MIVADTGAILALLDKGDRHHSDLRELYDDRPDDWLLPWAILPEVDYLVSSQLGARAQEAFLAWSITPVIDPIRSAAPAIAFTIEIAAAVVAVPIAVELEDNRRNAERAIITRFDIDAVASIVGLDITAGNPATAAVERHVAPRQIRKAAMDFD